VSLLAYYSQKASSETKGYRILLRLCLQKKIVFFFTIVGELLKMKITRIGSLRTLRRRIYLKLKAEQGKILVGRAL